VDEAEGGLIDWVGVADADVGGTTPPAKTGVDQCRIKHGLVSPDCGLAGLSIVDSNIHPTFFSTVIVTPTWMELNVSSRTAKRRALPSRPKAHFKSFYSETSWSKARQSTSDSC
jgi:hypothetical protein